MCSLIDKWQKISTKCKMLNSGITDQLEPQINHNLMKVIKHLQFQQVELFGDITFNRCRQFPNSSSLASTLWISWSNIVLNASTSSGFGAIKRSK